MKKLLVITIFIMSAVTSATTYNCGSSEPNEIKYDVEFSAPHMSLLLRGPTGKPSVVFMSQVGEQAKGGVFESREGFRVDIDGEGPMHLSYRSFGKAITVACVKSAEPTLASQIFDLTQRPEILAAAGPSVALYNKLYGRTALRSLADCHMEYWNFANVTYKAEVQRLPLSGVDLNQMAMYKTGVGSAVCAVYNELYGGSIYGNDGYGTSAISYALESCRKVAFFTDEQIAAAKVDASDAGALAAELNELKREGLKFNRTLCREVMRIAK